MQMQESSLMNMIKVALPKDKWNSSKSSSDSSISDSSISEDEEDSQGKPLSDMTKSLITSHFSKADKGKIKFKNMPMNVGETVKHF